MPSSSRTSLRVTSKVEISLCHLADEALGSTGCGVSRCSRYLENCDWFYALADLRTRKIVKEIPAQLESKQRKFVRDCLINRWVPLSPWAPHVDRLGFHGQLDFLAHFLRHLHQHGQPLAGCGPWRFEAHLI